VLHSPLDPICLELVSPEAGLLFGAGGAWSMLLRAAGSDAVLARYRGELGTAVSREIEGQSEGDLWRAVSDFPCLVQERHPRSLLISMTLPLADVQTVLDGLVLVAHSNSFTFAAVGRVGVGHLLIAMWPAPDTEVTMVNFVNAASGLRNRLPRDASMAVLYCPPEARHHVTAWGPMPTDLESMRKVKMTLDPRDVLNRGRFLF
jgi:FAD/FMN-containing dehydrogenase